MSVEQQASSDHVTDDVTRRLMT